MAAHEPNITPNSAKTTPKTHPTEVKSIEKSSSDGVVNEKSEFIIFLTVHGCVYTILSIFRPMLFYILELAWDSSVVTMKPAILL